MIHKLVCSIICLLISSPLTAADDPGIGQRPVIIDKVQLIGDTSIDGRTFAEQLGIAVGEFVSAAVSAAQIAEAERRLRALGRYEEGFNVKLVRGKKFPHQTLVIEVQPIDPLYHGGSLELHHDPLLNSNYESGSYGRRYSLSAFVGQRDWTSSSLSWDLELKVDRQTHDATESNDNSYGDYRYSNRYHSKYDLDVGRLDFTVIQAGLGDTGLFMGINPMVFAATTDSAGYSSYGSASYSSRVSWKGTYRYFDLGLRILGGYRYSKWTFVASVDRNFARTISEHFSATETDSTGKVSNLDLSTERAQGTYQTSREFAARVGYTDKPNLRVVESGFESSLQWKRSGDDIDLQRPSLDFQMQNTWIVQRVGLSVGGGSEWIYQVPDDDELALERRWNLNTRVDVVTPSNAVLFMSGRKIFLVGREFDGNQSSGPGVYHFYQISAGLQYASPHMLYSLSAFYGQTDEDSLLKSNVNSSLKRLGVY